MILIRIRKRTIGIILFVVILCLVGATLYTAAIITQNENKYKSVLGMAQMFEDTHFIAYLSDAEAQGQSFNVEAYDIKKSEVVVRKPLTPQIQNEVFNYVKTIKSLYSKLMPFPEKGYVIRVPFDPVRNVDVKLLNESGIKTLDQIFIIVSEKEEPLILVLDSQRRPYFYTFSASIQPLMDYLQLTPGTSASDADAEVESEVVDTLEEQPTEIIIDEGPVG